MQNRRKVGSTYEEVTVRYLEKRGFQILERNFRCRFGEIDLIARDGETLVFLEVKYRRNNGCGNPAEAVTREKQKRICRVAAWYCMVHKVSEYQPCRFDVVAISGKNIEVIKNAFFYQ